MKYRFLLALLLTNASPPLGKVLHRRNDYNFAPISHEGAIFTIDNSVWEKGDFRRYFPVLKGDPEVLYVDRSNNDIFLIALVEKNHYRPIGSKLVIELYELDSESMGFINLGFDVIDYYTGLSAIANMGYLDDDTERIKKLDLDTNKYGLIDSIRDAHKFADLVSDIAIEHAPFVPVMIMQIPNNQTLNFGVQNPKN